jgi:hypothetical protein
MKTKDVRIGMKVVPHNKTVKGWEDFKNCFHWNDVKDTDHPYLFVVGKDRNPACYVLNQDEGAKGGNFYRASDFNPYEIDRCYSVTFYDTSKQEFRTKENLTSEEAVKWFHLYIGNHNGPVTIKHNENENTNNLV